MSPRPASSSEPLPGTDTVEEPKGDRKTGPVIDFLQGLPGSSAGEPRPRNGLDGLCRAAAIAASPGRWDPEADRTLPDRQPRWPGGFNPPLPAFRCRSLLHPAAHDCQSAVARWGLSFPCLPAPAVLRLARMPRSNGAGGRNCRPLPEFAGPFCQRGSVSGPPFGRFLPAFALGCRGLPDHPAKGFLGKSDGPPLFFRPLAASIFEEEQRMAFWRLVCRGALKQGFGGEGLLSLKGEGLRPIIVDVTQARNTWALRSGRSLHGEDGRAPG